MTLPTRRPAGMSLDSWNELKIISKLNPLLTFPYLKSRKRAVTTSTYLFTIYRPKRPSARERHAIFKDCSNGATLMLCLPPIKVKALLVTWQSTWGSLSRMPKMKQQDVLHVAETLRKSQVRAVIRSLDTMI